MEHKRFDLGEKGKSTGSATRGKAAASSGDKKKNVILLSIAGVAFAIAGYFVYSTFFAVPPAPEEATPEVEQAFQNAVQPPPKEDSQPMTSPTGSGKQSHP